MEFKSAKKEYISFNHLKTTNFIYFSTVSIVIGKLYSHQTFNYLVLDDVTDGVHHSIPEGHQTPPPIPILHFYSFMAGFEISPFPTPSPWRVPWMNGEYTRFSKQISKLRLVN